MSRLICCILGVEQQYNAQISQNVKYWYELCDVFAPIFTRCEELVPIYHSVKFAKCEICGSTKLSSTAIVASVLMIKPITRVKGSARAFKK